MTSTGSLFYKFILGPKPALQLPAGISVLNPYVEPAVRKHVKQFCTRFYNDSNKRMLVLGINPGRFGAGITGIPFTDPFALENYIGIPNEFEKRRELSSIFVYDVINAFGGPEKFYNTFLLSAVCPLGFLNGPKNFNYYDSPGLSKATHNFIIHSLSKHSTLNVSKDVIISFGIKNAAYLKKFNEELHLFKRIIVVEHPRYIMQYKLKSKEKYIDDYLDAFSSIDK